MARGGADGRDSDVIPSNARDLAGFEKILRFAQDDNTSPAPPFTWSQSNGFRKKVNTKRSHRCRSTSFRQIPGAGPGTRPRPRRGDRRDDNVGDEEERSCGDDSPGGKQGFLRRPSDRRFEGVVAFGLADSGVLRYFRASLRSYRRTTTVHQHFNPGGRTLLWLCGSMT